MRCDYLPLILDRLCKFLLSEHRRLLNDKAAEQLAENAKASLHRKLNAIYAAQCERLDQRIAAFKDELSIYEGSKGAVKFPLDQPLPTELISKIVQFRASENRSKAAAKAAKKKA